MASISGPDISKYDSDKRKDDCEMGVGKGRLESTSARWHPQGYCTTSKPPTLLMRVICRRSQPIIMEEDKILVQEARVGGQGEVEEHGLGCCHTPTR